MLAWGQVERDLCQNEGVRGYPTIKYWKGGAESKYQVSARPPSHSPAPGSASSPSHVLLLPLFSRVLTVVCAM